MRTIILEAAHAQLRTFACCAIENPMKNILMVDVAMNATFSVFQATDEEFKTLFPTGQEMDVIEDVIGRTGEEVAEVIFNRV